MNKILMSLVIFITVMVTALFVLQDESSRQSRTELSSERPLLIAVSQTPLSTPFFIAAHQHYFTQEGLSVEIVKCNGGVVCSNMLFDKKVSLATASESVVMFNSFERSDFSVLTSFVESDSDLKLLTRTNYGVRSVRDLTGRRVAVVKASASEFYMDSLLIINNLPSDAVEKIYMRPTDFISALYARDVDAISIWEPFGYLAEQQPNSNIINLGLPGVYQLSFNLLASNEMVVNDRQACIKLLRALDKAVKWTNQNPEQAQDIVSKALGIDPVQLKWSWDDFVFRLALGNSLLSNLQMQARWASNLGLVEGNPPDFRLYLQNTIFKQAIHPED